MRKHGVGSSLRIDRLDQFYTDPAYAFYFWNKVHTLLDLDSFDTFVEPCAGTGSFYELMPEDKRYGVDIDPQLDGIIKQDFLTWSIPIIPYGRVLTLTNPPFGRNSNLAIRFFNHAATFSSAIAMTVPRSFKKTTLHDRLNPRFKLIWEEDTPGKSFVNSKNEHVDVKTVSQIWKSNLLDKRTKKEYKHKDYFTFVKFEDKHDLRLRRIGWNSGKFYDSVEEKEKGQFFFIKVSDKNVLDKIKSIDFAECRQNTGGGLSISRKDVIELFFEKDNN